MSIVFIKSKKKIALFFSVLTSVFVLLVTIVMLWVVGFVMDIKAEVVLLEGMKGLEAQYLSGDAFQAVSTTLQSDSVGYQEGGKNYTFSINDRVQLTSTPPNDMAVELIDFYQKNQVFSRIVLTSGANLITSDVFENYFVPLDQKGFRKMNFNGDCLFVYTNKLDNGETLQVARFCALDYNQQRDLYLMLLGFSIVVLILNYLLGLVVAQRFLQPLEEMVGKAKKFVQNCYHELLTPITVMISSVDRAKMTKQYEEGIKSVDDDLKVVYQTLDFFRTQATLDQAQVEFERINVSEVLRKVIDKYQELFRDKNMEFNSDLAEVVKDGHDLSLRIVFENLCSNALKYTKQWGVVNLGLNNDGFYIENEVEDSATIDVSQIFNLNFRGKNTDGINGAGIGLSIVQEIISIHDWKITAKIVKDKVRIEIKF